MSMPPNADRLAITNTGTSMPLTLYFHPLASYCWKVLIALYENDIPFTPSQIDLGNPAERAALVKLWGIGKFPVLRDDARNETVPESSVIIEYLDSHYRGRTRFIPDDGDRALQTRLRDRFYDLYVHLPIQKIMLEATTCGKPGFARRRGGAGAGANFIRNDRTADGERFLGYGRRVQPRRLRRGAAAVLQQHGGAVRRCEQEPCCLFRAAQGAAFVRARVEGGGAIFPDGAEGALKWPRQAGRR
jgi:glutathione S-transferase